CHKKTDHMCRFSNSFNRANFREQAVVKLRVYLVADWFELLSKLQLCIEPSCIRLFFSFMRPEVLLPAFSKADTCAIHTKPIVKGCTYGRVASFGLSTNDKVVQSLRDIKAMFWRVNFIAGVEKVFVYNPTLTKISFPPLGET
ncbi:hypothetical protein, partial [Enterobacter roggenkampii]|uniref:hypothetical protein n=1 Tax=Enterobacter roggenkampii TaxID=1812935 RepID=UPI003D7CA056